MWLFLCVDTLEELNLEVVDFWEHIQKSHHLFWKMKITEIKQIGKSDNYRIYLNESYFLTLNAYTIFTYHLVVGMDIEESELEKIQFDGEKTLAFEKAVDLLSKGSKTTREMREYLTKKGYKQTVCNYVVETLEGYKYLNDEEYAKMFVSDKKNAKGKLMLKQLLIKKGISKEIIENTLENLNQDEEIVVVCEKYMKNKNKTSENKQKLYRHLLCRGFRYDEIKNAINKIFKEGYDDWNWYFRKCKNERKTCKTRIC